MAHVAGHFEGVSSSPAAPQVRVIAADRCLVWLRRGWTDLWRTPLLSLGSGLLVALAGLLLLKVTREAAFLAPALVGGFLLVAPFAASLFYSLSRQLERGQAASLGQALTDVRRNASATGLFGLVLALGMMVWARTCALTFALLYDGAVPDMSHPFRDLLFSGQYVGLLFAFVGIGALIAAVVFSLGVITAPMLIDRDHTDVFTAMLTSARCCLANPAAAVLWAGLIAAMVFVLGFGTMMIGLALVFPLLGHASWHAYRDLVEQPS